MTSHNEIAWWECELVNFKLIRRYASSLNAKCIETTPEDCTQEQYQAHIDYQINRKCYRRTTPSKKPDLPMLASEYNGEEISHYAYQPKLDGVRCIATNKGLISRKNTMITCCPHINMLTSMLPDGVKLDGELYVEKVGFEIINGMVRQFNVTPKHYTLKYHVFDLVDIENTFECRIELAYDQLQTLQYHYDLMKNMFEKHIPFNTHETMRKWLMYSDKQFPIHLVETNFGVGLDNTKAKQYLASFTPKYEGVMFRSLDKPYELNQRSTSLYKMKQFRDKEFEIVDIEERKNHTCVFICRHPSGVRFAVTPSTTNDGKRTILFNKNKHIGKWLKVKYDSTTNSGIPRNANGHEMFKKEELNDEPE